MSLESFRNPSSDGNAVLYTIVAVIAVLAIWLVPLLAIWSINTLFHAGIEHSILNWFATLVLIGIFSGSRS